MRGVSGRGGPSCESWDGRCQRPIPIFLLQVFQRREDGSVNFFRGWDAYRDGFGRLTGEHWLGEHPARLPAQVGLLPMPSGTQLGPSRSLNGFGLGFPAHLSQLTGVVRGDRHSEGTRQTLPTEVIGVGALRVLIKAEGPTGPWRPVPAGVALGPARCPESSKLGQVVSSIPGSRRTEEDPAPPCPRMPGTPGM